MNMTWLWFCNGLLLGVHNPIDSYSVHCFESPLFWSLKFAVFSTAPVCCVSGCINVCPAFSEYFHIITLNILPFLASRFCICWAALQGQWYTESEDLSLPRWHHQTGDRRSCQCRWGLCTEITSSYNMRRSAMAIASIQIQFFMSVTAGPKIYSKNPVARY